MDSRVLQTQEWLNATYGQIDGFPTVVEDGITGRSTFKALFMLYSSKSVSAIPMVSLATTRSVNVPR